MIATLFEISAMPATPGKLVIARRFRRLMTGPEARLWAALRGDAVGGFHFRRQQVIAGFIVDFYCSSARLVVEVDGDVHDSSQEYDRERDVALGELGLRVLRVSNREVENDVRSVVGRIIVAIERSVP